jgi:TetR/AcrR family transcriptional repressor of mexCD-oprJ operon
MAMMEQKMSVHDEQLLKKLTAAVAADPRSTTQELAQAAGISRATFNRFCGSREKLMEMIAQQAESTLREIIRIAQEPVERESYPAALQQLIAAHTERQEYLIFCCSAQNSLNNAFWNEYLNAMDKFFLGGQKAGVFRVDIPYQTLSELFVSVISGMIDAQSRGRVAAFGMENVMASFFLNGAAEK